MADADLSSYGIVKEFKSFSQVIRRLLLISSVHLLPCKLNLQEVKDACALSRQKFNMLKQENKATRGKRLTMALQHVLKVSVPYELFCVTQSL